MYKLSIIVLMKQLDKENNKILDILKNQTLKELEILCIKDNLEDYQDYSNIKVVKDFKEALETASGEYTVITNTNISLGETWAEKAYDYAKIGNEDIIVCDLDVKDYNENILKSYALENIENDINKTVILNWNLCNVLFKTEKIKNINLKINNKYNELLFILEAMSECENIGYAQDIKCDLYMKENEFDNIELRDVQDLEYALKEAKNIYKTKNKYNEKYKNILSAIAFILLGVNTIVKLKRQKEDLKINIQEEIKDIINYLDINFFEWRNNNILKSAFIKKEMPYIWYANKMYKYGYIELYTNFYKFMYRNTKNH